MEDIKNIELFKSLLDKDFNPEKREEYGNTALMRACKFVVNITPELVSHFLDAKFDPDDPDYDYHTPLMVMVRDKGNYTEKVVLKLLEAKADPNIQDKNGMTALMHCVSKKGTKKIFKMLLRFGADITLMDNEGKDLFHHFGSDFNMGKILKKML